MALTLPYPTLTTLSSKSELQSNFSALSGKFGSIVNADIDSSAAIAISKLAASKEYIMIRLSGASTTTANALVDFYPIPDDGKGAWTVVAANYLLVDQGSTAPTIRLRYGYYTDGSTTWNAVAEIVNSTTIGSASDGNNINGALTLNSTSIDPAVGAGDVRGLGFFMGATAGIASGVFYTGVLLKRDIAT